MMLLPQRDVVFVLVPVASFAIIALFRYARHRCRYRDPLFKRDRLCIACYRELFRSAEIMNGTGPPPPTQTSTRGAWRQSVDRSGLWSLH
jgi:hypothetical protein